MSNDLEDKDMSIIGLKDIYKNFGENEVLKNISLDIKEKEFISIVGKSGSGKSTLLYVMGGLEEATNGQVLVDGRDISQLNDIEKSKVRCNEIGFVFQFYNLIQNLTVEENILLPSLMLGKKRNDLKNKLDKILDLVEISNKRNSIPSRMSGGEQQRVSIARALINEPRIVLADELTGNLDSKTGIAVMNILKTINQELNTTIVHVTHNLDLIEWGKRLITLKDGIILKDETI